MGPCLSPTVRNYNAPGDKDLNPSEQFSKSKQTTALSRSENRQRIIFGHIFMSKQVRSMICDTHFDALKSRLGKMSYEIRYAL